MMGQIRVTTTIRDKELKAHLGRVSYSAVNRAGDATVRRARTEIVKANRIRTGAMYRSVQHSKPVEERPGLYVTRVTAPTPYTDFQRFGIGPVRPVRAKVLRFQPKGSIGYVFAQRTKGFEGVDFLAIAARSIRLSDFI